VNTQTDPRLQWLFEQANQNLDGEALTQRVVAATRRRTLRLFAGATLISLAVLAAVWVAFAVPLLEFGVLLSRLLTSSLIDLGDGWLALLLLPLNSVGGLLALCIRGALLVRRRLSNAGSSR
jgi:hypothetical protein